MILPAYDLWVSANPLDIEAHDERGWPYCECALCLEAAREDAEEAQAESRSGR